MKGIAEITLRVAMFDEKKNVAVWKRASMHAMVGKYESQHSFHHFVVSIRLIVFTVVTWWDYVAWRCLASASFNVGMVRYYIFDECFHLDKNI